MRRFQRLTPRQYLIVLHDLVATAAAIVLTFLVRFEGDSLDARVTGLKLFLPFFVIYAAIVYFVIGLHQNKWRFTSVPDLFNIFKASTVLAVSLLALDYVLLAPNFYGTFFFGKVTILLYWFLQMFLLGGTRVAYRYFHYAQTLQRVRVADATPTLILGRAADAEVLLRAIESGAVKKIWPVGILSPARNDRGQAIRGIQVFGDIEDLEQVVADLEGRGSRVTRLLLTPSVFNPEARPEALLIRARRLGVTLSQLPSLDGGATAVQLQPVAVEDLLLRPSVKIDYQRLENFVAGKAIVVTGGGGSIGSEICERVVTFGAGRLLVIENSEPALHAVLESLRGKQSEADIVGRIADIRDRQRIMQLVGDFKPDIVFHAAALKHVPLLELDWDEGIKTNVFGSMNVADAAAASGASAMVMISTDKAIEPVSVLGATKRLAEMYCEALDHELARKGNGQPSTRMISVRFGNVLASNGSVVPKFKAQIEAGGPVTVTHPDMVRYFMTIREACDLVITAATHALRQETRDVSVYVLNMGQPVKIVDLAERIIRLSGLEPGRDIKITFTGVRPGERLHEILFARGEEMSEIGIPGIVAAKPFQPSMEAIRGWVVALEQGLARNERTAIYNLLRDAVPEFRGEAA
ncbi:polysaccharide biosynthesis protein [Pseudolabrys taiwanensis]|uniref:Polysaccharide biosynthesis protein n=1 Tax=Pseudolabrys taiwanensis TaxID=331696 RepID=A0A345ZWL0_9HYPH|nr:nucleoside-diphosphate sugar epimerase/dehydratase [Pseudolabrys taiwanensis]AXK81307.1 polysaccharide biosynthesis protein [Pseudolabrys taiwanensis]